MMEKMRCKPLPLAVSLITIFVFASLLQATLTGQGDQPPTSYVLSKTASLNRDKEFEREDEPEEAAEFFQMKRSPDGHSPVPVERYIRAIEHTKEMLQYSLATRAALPSENKMRAAAIEPEALGAWTPLGPGNIGGRTRALLINPDDPNIMYAAGVAGGVWKTVNGGASWTPLGDLLPHLAICSMAFDPTNPNIIYAGTGEGFFNGDGLRGSGIFKTVDGGANWTHLASTVGDSNFYYVNDLQVSRNNSRRVYAATRTGVWRSDDGGSTWNRIFNPLNVAGNTVQGGCPDLAMRTDQTTDYLFASCGSLTQATVYRNKNASDAASPWEPVLNDTNIARTSLAIAPSDQNIIYALASSNESGNFNTGLFAVFRSNASGDAGSWTAQVRNTDATKLNTVLLSNPISAFSRDCSPNGTNSFVNQGWYDNVIAVDPTDPNRVWAGGIDLFRSDDGGINWGVASYWWADRADPHYAHADNHAIVFHPQYNGSTNRIMFVASDGGVFRTNNARAAVAVGASAPCDTNNTGVVWTSLINGYAVTQFYHGLPYPGGKSYVAGAQDNGTSRGTDDGGANNWTRIVGGDGGYVAINPIDSTTIFAETTRLSIRRSTDGGTTFQSSVFGITESSSNFLFINSFFMDLNNPNILWTGGRSLWRTTDGATQWTQASAPLSTNSSVGAIAIAPTDSNRVLAGLSNGFIFRNNAALTAGATTTWASAQPRIGVVSWLTFDPADANIAYATYSTFGGTHVWRSTDGGTTWNGIDGAGDTGIPDIPVHSLVVDPNSSQSLYLGTDLGVFVSLDGGANWLKENTGFANVITESLSIGTLGQDYALFAFTHGRGAWRVKLGRAPLKVLIASISGKKLFIYGQGFDDGAKILIDGEQQKTSNDEASPNTNLIAKKSGKKIAAGQTVSLQVKNADGTLSPAFRFTR